MAGVKSVVLYLTLVLGCVLTAGCRENSSAPDASAGELRKTASLLALSVHAADAVGGYPGNIKQ